MNNSSAILVIRDIIYTWRKDYNECRPHSTLNYLTLPELSANWRKGDSNNEGVCITN